MPKECPVCLEICAILNSHHVIPRCYGGHVTNNLLVDLCENCHKAIHYTAEAEYAGKAANYLTPQQYQRALIYINAIKKAKQTYELSGGGENLPKKVQLVIPQKDLTKMHKRKSDKGHSSLEKYVLDLIYRDIKQL